ncbi:hypothetical protein Lser_V15G38099 [Lactuca serriola]
MQLKNGKEDAKSVMVCKQKEEESIRDYYGQFTLATLNVPGHEEFLVTGAFARGLLPGHLSRKMQGTIPRSRDELKFCVDKYSRQFEEEERKEANLKVVANTYLKQEETVSQPSSTQQERQDANQQKHKHHSRHMSRRYIPFNRDDSRSGHNDFDAINKTPAKENKDKTKFCEYRKSKTHDTNECTVLKHEINEKQLVGNIVDIAKDLNAKFDEGKHQPKNKKDRGKDHERRVKILTITGPRSCSNRQNLHVGAKVYHQNILNIEFSMINPRPKHWDTNDPLHITSFISQNRVEQVYIDTGSRVNVIYEHCLR